MMLALMLSLLGSAPSTNAAPVAARSDDPPIKISLNQDGYFQRGDRARVKVKLADDGYVVVLRADAEGRVRVLFPLDPTGDAFVRGGRTLEVRGRGDRDAFYVDEREGSGVVLAARSVAPFKFDEFVRGDHWDYRVLSARDAGDDKEAALLDMVQRMAPDGHFDYDVQTYAVSAQAAYYPTYSSFGLRLGYGGGWGWPYYSRYSFYAGYGYGGSCFDPFFYDPFFCGAALYTPFYYAPYYYGYYSPFAYIYRPYVYRPFVYQPFPYTRRRTFGYFNSPGTSWTGSGIGPRLRIPQGALVTRRTSGGMGVRVRDASVGGTSTRGGWFPVRDRSDRPSDRATPVARPAPERRDGGSGGGVSRPAPSRNRDSGSSASGGRRSTGGGGGGGGWGVPGIGGGGGGGGGGAGVGGRGKRRQLTAGWGAGV